MRVSRQRFQPEVIVVGGVWSVSAAYVEHKRGISGTSLARMGAVCEVAEKSQTVFIKIFNELKLEFRFGDVQSIDILRFPAPAEEQACVVFKFKEGLTWARNPDPDNGTTWIPFDVMGDEPVEPFIVMEEPIEGGDLCVFFHGKDEKWIEAMRVIATRAAEQEDEEKVYAILSDRLDQAREAGCDNCASGSDVPADVYCTKCRQGLCRECDSVIHRHPDTAETHPKRYPLLMVSQEVKDAVKDSEGCSCEFVARNGTCGNGTDCPCREAGHYCHPKKCSCQGCFNPFNVAQPEQKKKRKK